MNTAFPHAYSKGVIVLVTVYENLVGAAEICAVELDSATELEVPLSRLQLPALLPFC